MDSAIPTASAAAASALAIPPFNRHPRMMQEYFVRKMRLHDDIHRNRIYALKTKAQAQAYVRDVQQKIQASFGPWPEKTPLNARITGTIDHPEYKIENIIFESRPGFLVTANLYLPKGKKLPAPGVIGTCGHSTNGKAETAYQSFAQGLARLGYVCLIYDPIGQGERLQYVNEKLKPIIGPGTREHIHSGNQQFLIGEFIGSWRAWDGIRALDYLLTRPEVDKNHLGVTGNSGGGTMTTWLSGVENRWTMTAPICFVTTFRHNLENELPADSEQCPPRALALGLDHCDFIAAMAPKPAIVLAKEKDFFDARGAEEAYARLKHIYRLLGAEDNVRLFIGPTYHGFTQENREAMYQLFNYATKVSDAAKEPPIRLEKDEALWCTPKGQVAAEGSKTVFSFTRETSKRLATGRSVADKDLKSIVHRLLNMPKVKGTPHYRIIRSVGNRKYPKPQYINYAVETEPGIHAVVTRLDDERMHSRPRAGSSRATLYISHHSADAELRDEPLIAEYLKADATTAFFACDVRGVGESRPGTAGLDSFLTPYGSDYFYSAHSIMFDRPYVGQKTFDVLRVIEWLQSIGHTEIHLIGKGWGALPATFAALLSDNVKRVTLKNALTSYAEVAETEFYKWPLSTLLPGALAAFDMPECYAELRKKDLANIAPWNAKAEIIR